jgi:sugar phosphate isomerase/epimerase
MGRNATDLEINDTGSLRWRSESFAIRTSSKDHDLVAVMTAQEWKRNADFLNETAARLRRLGLRLGYHNHNIDFAPISGTSGFDILLTETDPSLVQFEMDVGWVTLAGRDPVKELQARPGRYRLMHVKDVSSSTRPNFLLEADSTEVGSGVIDWKRLLPVANSVGVQKFFVEQEPPFRVQPLFAVAKSIRYLKSVPYSSG